MGVLANMGVTAYGIHEVAVFLVLLRGVFKHHIFLNVSARNKNARIFVLRGVLRGYRSSSTFGSHVFVYVLRYSATACVALELTQFHFVLDKP